MNEQYVPQDQVPLPPADAKVYTTACDYCIVACGYKAYVWPEGKQGGPKAAENAFGIDYPAPALSGRWPSPNQHSFCMVDGKKHHLAVVPDGDATVVNRGGNHSIRGGCIAQKAYHPDGPTKDRLKQPLLRVGGELVPVSWDLALDIMADVSRYVIGKFGEAAWGMKTFSYQFFENTYAISKLAFESIQTPAYAPHDKPGPGNDTAGVDDAGIVTFSASYRDYSLADVIFISGTDPFETKTVLFTDWMLKGHPNKIIMVLPRKTTGAAYAEKIGGLFLQIIPGTDTILHLAMIRLILEKGWQDREFIEKWIANRWEIDSGFGRGTRNTPWQWRTTWGKLGASYEEYREWILSYELAELSKAAEMTGIPAEKIEAAAEMIAKPVEGKRPKTSFVFEVELSSHRILAGNSRSLGHRRLRRTPDGRSAAKQQVVKPVQCSFRPSPSRPGQPSRPSCRWFSRRNSCRPRLGPSSLFGANREEPVLGFSPSNNSRPRPPQGVSGK